MQIFVPLFTPLFWNFFSIAIFLSNFFPLEFWLFQWPKLLLLEIKSVAKKRLSDGKIRGTDSRGVKACTPKSRTPEFTGLNPTLVGNFWPKENYLDKIASELNCPPSFESNLSGRTLLFSCYIQRQHFVWCEFNIIVLLSSRKTKYAVFSTNVILY